MTRALRMVAIVLVGACGDEARDGSEFVDPWMDDPLPPSCRETTTGPCDESSTGALATCEASSECPDGQVCGADFDGEIGTFVCLASCIATDDESSWCFDAAACCDALASCVRGLCIVADDGDETTNVTDASSSGGAHVDDGLWFDHAP